MNRNDRLRLWIVLIVIAVALAFTWPITGRVNLGLDLKGGAHIVLQAKDTPENPVQEDSIDRLLAVLRNRIDQYGVAEPIIQKSGTDRIIVDLPGIQDPAAALELIGRTAKMEFREVIAVSGASRAELLADEPIRSNYDDDFQFLDKKSQWEKALADFDNASADFVARSANIEGSIVAASEEDGRFYLLGQVLLSGGAAARKLFSK